MDRSAWHRPRAYEHAHHQVGLRAHDTDVLALDDVNQAVDDVLRAHPILGSEYVRALGQGHNGHARMVCDSPLRRRRGDWSGVDLREAVVDRCQDRTGSGRTTTPSFEEIYASHADIYDALVEREDHEGRLLPMLAEIAPLHGARVVELGAGTGRLTRLLVPQVEWIRAYDRSSAMLDVARSRLEATGHANWELGVADNKRLPVEDDVADVALAGWTFGHALGWYPDTWREEIGAALDEMARVLRPGGTALVLETLTTGSETAAPPTEGFARYYCWLETERGFSRSAVRTDYRFESIDEADRMIRFFFGDELGDRVQRERWIIVPESTGIWSRCF